MLHRVVATLDDHQRTHRRLGFPIAVIYKFADDQGPYLAALITYFGFLSLFPLLLLLVTILGFVLQGDPQLQAELVDSALAQFPVIGSQLRDNVHALTGSGVGLAVGILLTLYGCLGVADAMQNAFNRAWAVPRNRRPNPITSRLRSLLLLPVLGAGILVTTALASLTTGADAYGADMSTALRVLAFALAALANVGLFMLVFRVLTANEVATRDLRIGAVVAGVGWQVVQILGTYFVTHVLRGASEAYGVFGLVLGLIAWIYLLSLVTVLAVETSVVAERRLWPRALLTPFTDQVRLTRLTSARTPATPTASDTRASRSSTSGSIHRCRSLARSRNRDAAPDAHTDNASARAGPVDLPGDWRHAREPEGESYRWSKRHDRYAPFRVFMVTTRREGAAQIWLGEAIRGYTCRRARKYVVAFLSTGSHKSRSPSSWPRLRADSRAHRGHPRQRRRAADVRLRRPAPRALHRALPEQIYKERIIYPGAWNKVVVVAHEDEHETMLDH